MLNIMLKILTTLMSVQIIVFASLLYISFSLPSNIELPSELFSIRNNCGTSCNNIVQKLDKSVKVTRFGILCQELIKYDEKISSKVILTWNLSNNANAQNITFSIHIAEFASNIHWIPVNDTTETYIEVYNLNLDRKYQFRLGVEEFDIAFYSDWIQTLGLETVLTAPFNITKIEFQSRPNSDFLYGSLSFLPSDEKPCYYDVSWFPSHGNSNFYQKYISVVTDNTLVKLPELSYGTNYSIKIVPYSDLVGDLKTELSSFFLTPCRYFKGDKFISENCNSDRPSNLRAEWRKEMTELYITWKIPEILIGEIDNFEFSISIWKDTELPDNKLIYKLVPGNQTELILTDIPPSKILIIEIFAIVNEFSGQPEIISIHGRNKQEQIDSNSTWWIPMIISLSCLTVLSFLILFVYQKRSKITVISENTDLYSTIPDNLKKYVLPEYKIDIHEKLGQGEFGVVYKGTLNTKNDKEIIAIKKFIFMDNLLKEADIMLQLGRHPHIVSIRGICIGFEKMFLVLEYCPLGDLHTWLTHLKVVLEGGSSCDPNDYQSHPQNETYEDTHRTIPWEIFEANSLTYMYQVALAMEHISTNKLIHRDLAARNVLLHSVNTVKLADFGLMRDIYTNNIYIVNETPRLPLRWMAPETLETRTFTLFSDIWSFGVLMWEIMSFGTHPYCNLRNDEILSALQQGVQLEKPQYCSQELYDIMRSCWTKEPQKRPPFSELKTKLEILLDRKKYVQF